MWEHKIGYCESHTDVKMNIEILDAYLEELRAIAGMMEMSDMINLVSRFSSQNR